MCPGVKGKEWNQPSLMTGEGFPRIEGHYIIAQGSESCVIWKLTSWTHHPKPSRAQGTSMLWWKGFWKSRKSLFLFKIWILLLRLQQGHYFLSLFFHTMPWCKTNRQLTVSQRIEACTSLAFCSPSSSNSSQPPPSDYIPSLHRYLRNRALPPLVISSL